MGGVALGTGIAVFNRGVGGFPPLDRFVDSVLAFPGVIRFVGQASLAMTIKAETAGLFNGLRNPGYRGYEVGSECILVDRVWSTLSSQVLSCGKLAVVQGGLVLPVRGGQPTPLEQRYGVLLIVAQARAYPVRIVARCAEPINPVFVIGWVIHS